MYVCIVYTAIQRITDVLQSQITFRVHQKLKMGHSFFLINLRPNKLHFNHLILSIGPYHARNILRISTDQLHSLI